MYVCTDGGDRRPLRACSGGLSPNWSFSSLLSDRPHASRRPAGDGPRLLRSDIQLRSKGSSERLGGGGEMAPRMQSAGTVVFVVGLAAKLHDRTPTRASATLYFGLLGLAGHGLGSLIFWAAIPALAAYAAKDQVAAGHAWVAVQALNGAADGMGNLFVGLSALMAGWAIVTTKVLSPVLGWVGVIVGVAGLAVFVSPQNELLAAASFVLPIIWLIWAGNALRTAA